MVACGRIWKLSQAVESKISSEAVLPEGYLTMFAYHWCTDIASTNLDNPTVRPFND